MTYFVIFIFSLVVWIAKGRYDPSVPLLIVSFLVWAYLTVFCASQPKSIHSKKVETWFYGFFPWAGAVMMAIKPNLINVLDAFRPAYLYFKFIPLGLNVVSLRKNKLIEWSVALAFLVFFITALILSPNPFIDVFRSNTAAVDFFIHGLNPYSQSYIDIYGGGFDYHPGFMYWPMALYLQTISKSIFGDIRVILVFSWWIAAFFFPKNNPRSPALKKVWWFIPFLAFGFEQGWLDPLLSLAAAITLWAYLNKKWKVMSIAIASAASIKQYGFIIGIFPVIMLVLDRDWQIVKRVFLGAGLIFLCALLPFLIWDFQGFLTMTVTSHASALVRPDALNFTAWWMKISGTQFPGWLQLLMTMFGFLLAFYHLVKNRSLKGIAVTPESWAIAFGFSMMFGKFAFCNYHWLLISFWILSLAFEDVGISQS